MAKVIFTSTLNCVVKRGDKLVRVQKEIDTVAIPEGQDLYVRGIVGRTADKDVNSSENDMCYVEDLDDGHTLLTFKQDVLVRVEGLHDNLMTCEHLRFARFNRPRPTQDEMEERSGRKTLHNKVRPFPRLLAAMLNLHIPTITVPGGLRYAVAFRDEVIVPAPKRGVNYRNWGEVTAGYIVRKEEIKDLLATLPEREEDDEFQRDNTSTDTDRYH